MADPIVRIVIPALWAAWILYWLVSAGNVKASRWTEPPLSQALHRVPLMLAALLLISRPPWMTARFLPAGSLSPALGASAVAAGLSLAVWARRHLGRNWSAAVTLKEDHTLVRTGPYRLVRHPIYTGILLGLLGTAVALGEWRGLLAVALALAGFIRKLHVEEDRMREAFLEYDQYQEETAALIPCFF